MKSTVAQFSAATLISSLIANTSVAQSLEELFIQPLFITKSCAVEKTMGLIGDGAEPSDFQYSDLRDFSARTESLPDRMADIFAEYAFVYKYPNENDTENIVIEDLFHTYQTDLVVDPTWDAEYQAQWNGAIQTTGVVDSFVNPEMNGKPYWTDSTIDPKSSAQYDIEGQLAKFYRELESCLAEMQFQLG